MIYKNITEIQLYFSKEEEIMMGKTLIKSYKEEDGITLIALIVTIIVLLILAGVSLAMLTGENRDTFASQ